MTETSSCYTYIYNIHGKLRLFHWINMNVYSFLILYSDAWFTCMTKMLSYKNAVMNFYSKMLGSRSMKSGVTCYRQILYFIFRWWNTLNTCQHCGSRELGLCWLFSVRRSLLIIAQMTTFPCRDSLFTQIMRTYCRHNSFMRPKTINLIKPNHCHCICVGQVG